MVAKLEAIKQNFLSCDELEENNYLKEESKAGFLQALVYALVFKNVKISCRSLWITESILPLCIFSFQFLIYAQVGVPKC